MPVWRGDADELGWEELADEIGVDRSSLPPVPRRVNPIVATTSNDTEDSLSEGVSDNTFPPTKQKKLFDIIPRFTWGDFEAVSYCWESEVRDRHIVVD